MTARDLVARLGVEERRVSAPLWEDAPGGGLRPAEPPALGERYRRYLDGALGLAARASRRALRQAGVHARAVDEVVLVCTSGPLLYNAASMLHAGVPRMGDGMRRALGLSDAACLSPRVGLGTAGGVAGISDAAGLVRSGRARTVLVVVVELLSFIFGPAPDEPERDPARALASLFFAAVLGDGAAAAVVCRGDAGDGAPGPTVAWGHSALWPGTEGYLRYEPCEGGYFPRIDPGLPDLVRERAPADFAAALAACPSVVREAQGDHAGPDAGRVSHLVHPHAARVLDSYAGALGLPAGALDHSRDVLRANGNMSAPTVFFVLERFLAGRPSLPQGPTPSLAVLSAVGPGVVSEHAFLEL